MTPESPDRLLKRLEWTVLRRLDGLLQGDYRTSFRGNGLDLADLREYQFGDDVRHIDWNVTARLQVPHVRRYTEDRELTAWFLIDLSGSIDFGSAERTKLALAEGFVAVVARLLTRHGNRVGAIFYRQGIEGVLPPGAGRNQVLQLLSRMRQPPAKRPPKPQGTDLGELLRAAEAGLRRRAMVFVLSDFISAPGWAAPLGRLAKRHEVLALRLYDALEMSLPDAGLLTVQDIETGEQLFIDTSDPAFRARYEALATRSEAELRSALAAAGVDTLELATDDDLMTALLRFVALRRQRHRLPGARRRPASIGMAQAA